MTAWSLHLCAGPLQGLEHFSPGAGVLSQQVSGGARVEGAVFVSPRYPNYHPVTSLRVWFPILGCTCNTASWLALSVSPTAVVAVAASTCLGQPAV